MVLEMTIQRVAKTGLPVLVEATANQVNQDGGYTGMRPIDFYEKLEDLCMQYHADRDLVIFGGDHLGPYPWRRMKSDDAMASAELLVREYVAAGAGKIHLDASMNLGGDSGIFPEPEVVAQRAARLCKAAEDEYRKLGEKGKPPVYVIGTEVPLPGGVVGEDPAARAEELTAPRPTTDEALSEMIAVHENAFSEAGLTDAWERVIAAVVQPGLEFESAIVHPYKRERAELLLRTVTARPHLFFEAHSTDYQSDASLAALVKDGFIFLKVGPALTFAFREALLGLSHIERQLTAGKRDRIEEAILATMRARDKYWKDYYSHDDRIDLLFSLSDRVRYYWDNPELHSEVENLFSSLNGKELSPGLISQYLPRFAGPQNTVALERPINPRTLVMKAIDAELSRYETACFPNGGR
jgi:D-tagatose-1,6-bisphosphate aldolase subunit GatZ/KbaZ